ncbi:MAG: ankyrin repeat domain-containing protein [Flavobacterium sp.]
MQTKTNEPDNFSLTNKVRDEDRERKEKEEQERKEKEDREIKEKEDRERKEKEEQEIKMPSTIFEAIENITNLEELDQVLAHRKKKYDDLDDFVNQNVTDKNQNLVSALAHAIAHDNIELVKILIKYGANLNDRVTSQVIIHSNFGRLTKRLGTVSHLCLAVAVGNIKIVEILLQNGADTRKYHCDPLDIALENNSLEIAELLINYGSRIRPFRFVTTLRRAILNDNIKMAEFSLKNGINHIGINNINNDNGFALYHALQKRSKEMVKVLISYGLDPYKPIYGITPVEQAERMGDEWVILLIGKDKFEEYKKEQEREAERARERQREWDRDWEQYQREREQGKPRFFEKEEPLPMTPYEFKELNVTDDVPKKCSNLLIQLYNDYKQTKLQVTKRIATSSAGRIQKLVDSALGKLYGLKALSVNGERVSDYCDPFPSWYTKNIEWFKNEFAHFRLLVKEFNDKNTEKLNKPLFDGKSAVFGGKKQTKRRGCRNKLTGRKLTGRSKLTGRKLTQRKSLKKRR